jgi:hypothetical protein
MKDYLILLLCTCAPANGFAQDAIEHAVLSGFVSPCGEDLDADVQLVMGQYDQIVVRFHNHIAASMP